MPIAAHGAGDVVRRERVPEVVAGVLAASVAASSVAADMTDGEVKKVDKPGLTMVFQVKDPAMLDMVKTGDKVKFKADKADGAIVVTGIQIAK